MRLCDCPGPMLTVLTDGKREWASYPTCRKSWDGRTLKPLDMVEIEAESR